MVTQGAVRGAVDPIGFIGGESRAVKRIGALLHDDVDHAAQGAAVFRLDAGGLNLDFLDELEGDVGLGSATGDVLRVLAFHKEGVLRISSATDGETDR